MLRFPRMVVLFSKCHTDVIDQVVILIDSVYFYERFTLKPSNLAYILLMWHLFSTAAIQFRLEARKIAKLC